MINNDFDANFWFLLSFFIITIVRLYKSKVQQRREKKIVQ